MAEHESVQPGQVIAFGSFRLFPSRQQLLDGDQPVSLGSRALEILLLLVRHAGELVGKADLIAQVWPATFVDETNLRVHVAALRKALGDGQAGNRYVVTIPGRGYRFVAPVTVWQMPPGPATTPVMRPRAAAAEPRDNLPFPLARMVGRADVIAALSAQLPQRRFITLVGPGGIGKTTVALAVARELASSKPDGVGFVDFGPIGGPALVASSLASMLGLPIHSEDPLTSVIAFLEHRQMLIVLDSCEHVIEMAAAIAEDIFNAAPGVTILATSREPLRAAGERVHRLAPLETPIASDDLTAAEALEFPSVQLFVERAAAGLGEFNLSDADAPLVADICRRLDGIALAIELAAGRVAAFGVRELASRLDDRFRLLMSGRRTALPRHQTLAATLEWSYKLLPEEEQTLLRQLAVFAGEFTLESAVAVASDRQTPQIIGHVGSLVAKSLVATDLRGDRVHYRLLDTTRLFCLEKLKSSDEFRQTAQRHADYLLGFVGRAPSEIDTRPKADWLATFGGQIDNLRAALEWAFSAEGDAATGVALTIAAVPLWVELSLMAECRGWVERALASLGGGASEAMSRARMQLSAALGWSRMFAAGPARETGAAWETTLVLAEQLGDAGYVSRALWGLWVDSLNNGAMPQALELAERFERTVAGSADAIDRLMADRMLATTLHFMGDQSKAREHIERMLRGYVTPGRQSQITAFQFDQRVTAHYFQARILWLQGLADQAMRIVDGTIAEAQSLGHALLLGSVLGQGACPLALFTGNMDTAEHYAAMLLNHADKHALRLWHIWARCLLGLVRVRRGDVAAGIAAVRSGLGDAAGARLLPRYLPLLGEFANCLGQAGEVEAGLALIEEALARSERTGEQWYLAELLRISGELVLAAGTTGAEATAEAHFLRALDWGRRQGALAWELRAATSLGRLQRRQGRLTEARDHMQGVLGRFSEGFETADMRAANQLLEQLT